MAICNDRPELTDLSATSPDFTIRKVGKSASSRGYTFIELIVVSAVLAILASAIVPLTRVTMQRQREIELRRNLREVRTAIDKFKDAVDLGIIPQTEVSPGSEGYPKTLEQLVAGASVANDASGRRLKFLRRVPIDPMTNTTEWDLRAVQDDEDSRSWGGGNVFDIRTKSGGTALDGSRYRDW
jgi:general secretion pathway protein G